MHYWGGTVLNDNDQDKDMQLPFKKVELSSFIQIAIPTPNIAVEKQQFYTLKISYPLSQNADLSNPALSSLFRPPRA